MRLSELIRDGDGLFFSSGVAEPSLLIDEFLSDVAPYRRYLEVFQVLTGSSGNLVSASNYGHRVSSPAPGRAQSRASGGVVEVVDLSMRMCALAIEQGSLKIDGAVLSAVRVGDTVWPVPATDLAVVAFEKSRFRAVQVLEHRDWAPNGPSFAASEVDYWVEGASHMRELGSAQPTAESRRIAELVAEIVPAGAAVEVGVGRALASVAECLIEANLPVAVHTGLISDWTRDLVEAGVARVALPCAGGRSVVGAVAMGSTSFYEWLRQSDAVVFAESRHAHDWAHLMALGTFVAINSAAAVDLNGQVGLPTGIAEGHPSGGLLDFAMAGAYAGASVIAMTSKSSSGMSRIVRDLGAVHLPVGMATHIVTEHGVAALAGRSRNERRREMLRICSPDLRDELASGQ